MPHADRPHMPGYDLPAPADGAKPEPSLLPWAWALERLVQARNYWVATTHPDGRPHAMPVWGIWLDQTLVFSTSDTSRKAKNLARDARCTITTEMADEAVIVEGLASALALPADEDLLRRWVVAYRAKYDWEMDPAQPGIFQVTPKVAFGFIERADQFATTATRWRFEAETTP